MIRHPPLPHSPLATAGCSDNAHPSKASNIAAAIVQPRPTLPRYARAALAAPISHNRRCDEFRAFPLCIARSQPRHGTVRLSQDLRFARSYTITSAGNEDQLFFASRCSPPILTLPLARFLQSIYLANRRPNPALKNLKCSLERLDRKTINEGTASCGDLFSRSVRLRKRLTAFN
jgi:hypothetical protein